jgi:DNA-binding IclR family transcriptional regulator
MGKGPLESFTPKTITESTRLRADLRLIRNRGYALSQEEVYEGARGVAAAIFDGTGAVCGSLAIPGPVHRFRNERLERAALLVKKEAERLSIELGFQDPRRQRRVGR